MSKLRFAHDLRELLVRQAVDVELRAEEVELLGAPPGEADLVLRLDVLLRDLDRRLEVVRRARAVVVDARARRRPSRGASPGRSTRFGSPPGVSASTFAVCRISDCVVGLDVHRHRAAAEQRVQLLPDRERRADHRDVEVGRAERAGERVGPAGLALVEDHDGRRAGGLRVERLVVERARPALDQRDPCPARSRRSRRPRSRRSTSSASGPAGTGCCSPPAARR